MAAVARLLAMDRTTLTAALKPLARRGLLAVRPDRRDARHRLLMLTAKGRAVLAQALPIWEANHAALEQILPPSDPGRLRQDLTALAGQPPSQSR